MQYKLFTTYTEAWDSMLRVIDGAQKSIYIEMYAFLDVSKHFNFVEQLKIKSSAGVRVVLITDSYGSASLKKESVAELRAYGVEVIFCHNFFHHDHKKIIIVDEAVAFIGGMNIGKQFLHWHDLQLKISGAPVGIILRAFAHSYKLFGGTNKHILNFHPSRLLAKLQFWIFETIPAEKIHSLRDNYARALTDARKNIQITTPYFNPPRAICKLLKNAAQRGVSVEIIIPKKTNYAIANSINYLYMRRFSKVGVTFFLLPTMNHSKLLSVDGNGGLVGSQNLNYLSFKLNSEIGFFFTEPPLVRELGRVITRWKREAEVFDARAYKKTFIDYVIFPIMRLFTPFEV